MSTYSKHTHTHTHTHRKSCRCGKSSCQSCFYTLRFGMRAPRVDASHTSHTVLPSPRACPLCAAPLPRSARPSRRRGRSGTKKSGRSKERRACTRAGSARTRVRLPPPLPQPPSWRLTRYWNCPRRQTWCPAQVRRPRPLPRPPGRLRLSTSCPHRAALSPSTWCQKV